MGCNYNLKYYRLNKQGREQTKSNNSTSAHFNKLRQKVNDARDKFESIQNTSTVTLKNADDLIKGYKILIGNHNSNNTNRNATFENETRFLENLTLTSTYLDTKFGDYLVMSK